MHSVLRVEGGHPLQGTIMVRGAKNFVPKAMVASLLGDGPSQLSNVPLIRTSTSSPIFCPCTALRSSSTSGPASCPWIRGT